MARSISKSTSAAIATSATRVYGFIVASHSSGTLKLEDSVGGGQNLIVDTITFAAGPQTWTFPAPITCNNGLYATIGGTATIDFIID